MRGSITASCNQGTASYSRTTEAAPPGFVQGQPDECTEYEALIHPENTKDWTSSRWSALQTQVNNLNEPMIHDIPNHKYCFVRDHLSEANMGIGIGGEKLNVPLQNLLGLSALESGWGASRFAILGHNFFGLHAPAHYQSGTVEALDSDASEGSFPTYEVGMKSFIYSDKYLVKGVRDPARFARALQNSMKFGINPQGEKVPNYVRDVCITIINLPQAINTVISETPSLAHSIGKISMIKSVCPAKAPN